MNERTDEQLMHEYCHGDATAFDALYARHRRRIFGYLLRHAQSDRAEVEEVFQECWLKVIRQREQFDPAQPFLPWLFTIARHCLVDRWRHLGRVASLQVSSDVAMLGASSNGLAHPERRMESATIETRWQAALADLPPEQRDVLLLQLESDMTLEQIGEVIGCNRETVKSRLRYAMNKLRHALGDLEIRQ